MEFPFKSFITLIKKKVPNKGFSLNRVVFSYGDSVGKILSAKNNFNIFFLLAYSC